MKKTTIYLTALVMFIASSAFALDGDNVSSKVAKAFKTDFSLATTVHWSKTDDFYFASFRLNDVSVEAAYNADGELLGTSRKISLSQVPLNISLGLSKKFAAYQLPDEVFELNFEGQTNYSLSVEDNKQVLNLKCYTNGDIDIVGRVKK